MRDEGWRLVLTGLDSRCFEQALAMTGDAGSLYSILARGQHPIYFGILVLEQVVNVTLSKLRFQIYLGLAVDRLAMDYVAW